jgi:ParB family transcriptional regulator, chromosome partitioning protein
MPLLQDEEEAMTDILLSKIIPNPSQPRHIFDESSITELANSISENGLLQPILVEDNLDGTYTLVGGERRWRAYTMLQRETIPATVRARTNHGGRELLVHAIVENVQRVDMNPVDEAKAYQNLHDVHGMTWVEIAKAVGKHPSAVSARVVLLNLDDEIQKLIVTEKFTSDIAVARAFLSIPDKQARIKLAEKVSASRATNRQALDMALRLSESLSVTNVTSGVPALRLSQNKTGIPVDERMAPSGWNALKQAGKVPAWEIISESVMSTCKNCALSSSANEVVCRDCPMVEFVIRLVKHG